MPDSKIMKTDEQIRQMVEDDKVTKQDMADTMMDFRRKYPEIHWWVKKRTAIITGLVVAAFFGGDAVDPTSIIGRFTGKNVQTHNEEVYLEDEVVEVEEEVGEIEDSLSDLKDMINKDFVRKEDFNKECDRLWQAVNSRPGPPPQNGRKGMFGGK